QRAHRAFQDSQERQSLAARPAEDGLAPEKFARLLEEDEYPAVPRSRGPAGTTKIVSVSKKKNQGIFESLSIKIKPAPFRRSVTEPNVTAISRNPGGASSLRKRKRRRELHG